MSALLQRLDDWLSPMLVKELRQGIKSRAFTGSFMLLQGLMVISVVMYLSALDSQNDLEFFDGVFWVCVGAPLILLVPGRGFNAIQSEVKEKTLDLILLTRLSAWRILFGKWASLFTQALLTTCAVLPYAVLRYFLGSVNLADDLAIIGGLLCASGILTAASVAFSTFRTPVFRTLFAIGIVFAFNIIPILLFGALRAVSRGGAPMLGMGWSAIAVPIFSVLLILLLLQWGAGRIAPPSENHEVRKRLTALSLILVAFISAKLGAHEGVLYLALVFLIPVCIDALMGQPRAYPAIYTPFVKRGRVARLVGRYLYPGWPSGLLYSLLVLTLLFLLLAAEQGFTARTTNMFGTLIGAICLPLAAVVIFKPSSTRLMAFYFALQIVLVVLTVVFSAMDSIFPHKGFSAISAVPTAAFFRIIVGESIPEWMPVALLISGASVALLALLMIRPWREIVRLENSIAARLRNPAHPPPLP